jgi:DNA-binding transcriptional ArsR family regulator
MTRALARKIDASRVFQALGDSTRRAIVERLSQAPASVTHLSAPLRVTPTAIGQHLQILEECGLVRTEKIGRVRICRIDAEGFSVLEQWIGEQRSLWNRRLDRLGDLLAEDDE